MIDFFSYLFTAVIGGALGYLIRVYVEVRRERRKFEAWSRARPFFSSHDSKR